MSKQKKQKTTAMRLAFSAMRTTEADFSIRLQHPDPPDADEILGDLEASLDTGEFNDLITAVMHSRQPQPILDDETDRVIGWLSFEDVQAESVEANSPEIVEDDE